MRFKELLQAAEKVSVPADLKSRRRPGRNNQVSPHLIPLLRNPATVDIPAPPLNTVDMPSLREDLTVAKGIVLALAVSVPLWAIVGAVVWAVLR